MKQQLLKKKRRVVEVPDANPSSQEAPVDNLQACIAHRAYELYEQEGCCHGHDLDQWLQAEQDVLSSEPRR